MSRDPRVFVHLRRLSCSGTVTAPTVAAAHYESFFEVLYPASRLAIQRKDEELKDVLRLAASLTKLFSSKKAPQALILECLDLQADVREYDRIAEAIALTLESETPAKPECVLLAVSDTASLAKSVWLKRKLIAACESTRTALITMKPGEEASPTVWVRGTLVADKPSRSLPALGVVWQPLPATTELTLGEIQSHVDFLFGHFEVMTPEGTRHVSHLASVERLAKFDDFIVRIRRDLQQHLQDPDFRLRGYGVNGGAMPSLCLRIVDGERSRILRSDSEDCQGEAIAVICDFLDEAYPIERDLETLKRKGARRVVVVGVLGGRLPGNHNAHGTIHYLDIDREVSHPDACRFDRQGVSLVCAEDFDGYARELLAFDSFTFWRLVSEEPSFHSVGHWTGDRTPNHYYFRILAKPLFERYSYALAIRLKNLLRAKGILPRWIRKLVCTEGEESTILSTSLADVLGLSARDIITIPRQYFRTITGQNIGSDVVDLLERGYGKDALRGKNVLIVDQAAHHFRTFSGLRSVCEHFDCTVLGFAVFIDRTDSQVPLGDYLPHAHYLTLYSWPCSARRDFECVCEAR